MIWNNIYPAEAHKLERFRKVAHKSEEVGPPCFRETSQHFGNLLQCSKGTDQLKFGKLQFICNIMCNVDSRKRVYLLFFFCTKQHCIQKRFLKLREQCKIHFA